MKEKKEINMQIGERIRKSRDIAGFTQEKLAESVSVSIQYISDLERGIVGTSITTLIKICETLNVSSDYILLGREQVNNLPGPIERLRYLPDDQLEIVGQGINILLDALSYTPKQTAQFSRNGDSNVNN